MSNEKYAVVFKEMIELTNSLLKLQADTLVGGTELINLFQAILLDYLCNNEQVKAKLPNGQSEKINLGSLLFIEFYSMDDQNHKVISFDSETLVKNWQELQIKALDEFNAERKNSGQLEITVNSSKYFPIIVSYFSFFKNRKPALKLVSEVTLNSRSSSISNFIQFSEWFSSANTLNLKNSIIEILKKDTNLYKTESNRFSLHWLSGSNNRPAVCGDFTDYFGGKIEQVTEPLIKESSLSILRLGAKKFLAYDRAAVSATDESIFQKKKPDRLQGDNIVYFGPPGTGKTRAAQIAAYLIVSEAIGTESEDFYTKIVPNAEFPAQELRQLQGEPSDPTAIDRIQRFYQVQFHPSFQYEEFIEGLKPVNNVIHDGKVRYEIVPGVFKAICDLASAAVSPDRTVKLLYSFEEGHDGKYRVNIDSNFTQIYKIFENEGKHIVEMILSKIDKERPIEKKGYNYFDWMPSKTRPKNSFKNFVIVIDEINRGNLSKIFGEVLSAIEKEKRLGSDEPLLIMLPGSNTQFGVPANLTILGAMNTSDRSLAIIDQALRRRFEWIPLAAQFERLEHPRVLEEFGDGQDNVRCIRFHFEHINHVLKKEFNKSEDNLIGHSYAFKLLKKFKSDFSSEFSEERVVKALVWIWSHELHAQVRELVGNHQAEEFISRMKTSLAANGKEKWRNSTQYKMVFERVIAELGDEYLNSLDSRPKVA